MSKYKRYDELQVGDVIVFHGANVRIIDVAHYPADPKRHAIQDADDVIVNFSIEPADEEAIKIMGWFYSHGTYGGLGWINIKIAE